MPAKTPFASEHAWAAHRVHCCRLRLSGIAFLEPAVAELSCAGPACSHQAARVAAQVQDQAAGMLHAQAGQRTAQGPGRGRAKGGQPDVSRAATPLPACSQLSPHTQVIVWAAAAVCLEVAERRVPAHVSLPPAFR